jgi:hypothetical protein
MTKADFEVFGGHDGEAATAFIKPAPRHDLCDAIEAAVDGLAIAVSGGMEISPWKTDEHTTESLQDRVVGLLTKKGYKVNLISGEASLEA